MREPARIDISATILALLVCLVAANAQTRRTNPPPLVRTVEELMSVMTLDEKVGQLVQYSGKFSDPALRSSLTQEQRTFIRNGRVGSFLNVHGAAAREAQQIAVRESRLGIPLLFGLDVIHGFRTIFPIPLATAASWDPELVERCERIAAREAAVSGIHWTFAPMVDIARDPRWGRIAEGSGEDPYLGSVMAAARVRGFQGSDLRRMESIAACVKHFAAYGGAEGGRDYNTVDMSERTLREFYLPPYQAAVNAGVASVMCSFNEINGVPSSANRWLLTDLLRGEWGFRGMVVSDWNSIGELIPHGVAADLSDAAVLGLTAGVDMDMEAEAYRDQLAAAVSDGRVRMAALDDAVRRVLELKMKLGLFEVPDKAMDEREAELVLRSTKHREAARDAARRSIVLLKNSGILPLSNTLRRIALIGPLADNQKDPLGSWHAVGRAEDVVTVREGLTRSLPKNTELVYASGCGIADADTTGFEKALQAVRGADLAIVVLGESADMSGEAASRSSIALPGVQQELIEAIDTVGKPYIVVLMNGRPLSIPWISEHAPAILETWFLGVECGNAIADVLTGAFNPGGKLPVTFPRSVGQIPVHYNHPNSGRPANDTVKFSGKYIDGPTVPLYPFGYGLSYTQFSYGPITLSAPVLRGRDTLHVSVQVRNTGSRTGEEIVQLYLHDKVASATRPVRQLKRFARKEIASGARAEFTFALTADDLKFVDRSAAWVAEPGMFRVEVGPNSQEGVEAWFEYVAKE